MYDTTSNRVNRGNNTSVANFNRNNASNANSNNGLRPVFSFAIQERVIVKAVTLQLENIKGSYI